MNESWTNHEINWITNFSCHTCRISFAFGSWSQLRLATTSAAIAEVVKKRALSKGPKSREWPTALAKRGKAWQSVAKCGKVWQSVAKCGKVWQSVAKWYRAGWYPMVSALCCCKILQGQHGRIMWRRPRLHQFIAPELVNLAAPFNDPVEWELTF